MRHVLAFLKKSRKKAEKKAILFCNFGHEKCIDRKNKVHQLDRNIRYTKGKLEQATYGSAKYYTLDCILLMPALRSVL